MVNNRSREQSMEKESLEYRKPGSGGGAGEEQQEDGEQTPIFPQPCSP